MTSDRTIGGGGTLALKKSPRQADLRDMAPGHHDFRSERGFTLVEVLVAAIVLLVGVLGAFVLIDSANRTTSLNNARTAATNLTREVIEHSRGGDYDKLNPAEVATMLQAKPGMAGSGNPWQLERRGVVFEVKVSACTFDDPKDGLATVAPPNPCPKAAALAGAPPETNPDDFRNVTVTMTWDGNGRKRTLTQSTLIVNPSGGLGPRIVQFPEPPSQISTKSQTSVAWNGTVETTTASAVRWSADDGSGGDASGGPTSWSFSWNLGTHGVAPYVVDGAYTISVQAFDSRGVAGDSRLVAVLVNRDRAFAPAGLTGGRNARFGNGDGAAELRWNTNPERDVVGYRVYRVTAAGRVRVCPGSGADVITTTTCTDPDAPDGPVTYEVVAVDKADLGAATGSLRDGYVSAIVLSAEASKPATPDNLQVTDDPQSGLPRLNWTQAPTSPPVIFFRVYRDTGTDLEDRYAYTATSDPTWSDPNPGNALSHKYWVTAVDANYNESDPVGPVTWTAP